MSAPARTIAIGDVHGCDDALRVLLEVIDPQPRDTFIFLGDYVDRGPDSKGVIDRVMALGESANVVPLMGNHELMFLSSRENERDRMFWLGCGGRETLDSYGGDFDDVPDLHWQFMENCLPHHETSEHFFVHANYQYDSPLDDQPDYLRYWEHLHMPPPPHDNGKIAVVGHTPQRTGEIRDLGHLLCIDTYCFGGRWLTALDVETGDVWQASAQGLLRT